MIYFSYGSNMSFQRLNAKISRLGIAVLSYHDLRFHKVSHNDGSGKCDIFTTNAPEHRVIGVAYKIDPLEKPILDKHDGLGYGYEIKQVTVDIGEDLLSAFTYYASNIDSVLKPLHWYKEHVLRGASENALPDDHDVERHRRELAIHAMAADK